MEQKEIKEELQCELNKYKEGQCFKDYFVSMKELSVWLKEKSK